MLMGRRRAQNLQIRLTETEKAGFTEAPRQGGVPVTAWGRERLQLTATRELGSAGRRVPFVPDVSLEDAAHG